jgi:DNA-binding GntR family transcriptional regulator
MAIRAQPFTLQPAEGSSLVDHAWRQIRHRIVSGELGPGTRLTELDQRLEQDGLVERRARSATFVTGISREEMYEVFSVRSVVESFAVLRAAPHISAARLGELKELVEHMRVAGAAGDILTLSDYDLRFHMQICIWSAHPMLLRVWIPLFTQVQRFIVANHPHFFPDLVEVADTHQPVLDAISGGSPELAADRMREHIMLIWSRIEGEGEIPPAHSERAAAYTSGR